MLKKFLKTKNIEMIGKYSNTVLFKLESKNKVDKVIKYLFKNKFIVRPMKIDNDDKYIRATLGSSHIMKKFIHKLNTALGVIKVTQWGKKNVVEFYANNRNKVSDLYLSEKKPLYFIDKKKIKSILDYGCAVGGFYKIFQKYFNKIFIMV